MIRMPNQGRMLAERVTDTDVRSRAEQMFRERLAAQIKIGLIKPGEPLNPKALRRELEDCTHAAIYALNWEQANPDQQWLPAFTDSTRSEGLNERRYRQYTPPTRGNLL